MCPAAWDAAVANWKNTDAGRLAFPASVSNFFNGPDSMQCEVAVSQNGCTSPSLCNNAPAGFLILNSMVALNNIITNFYDSIVKSQAIVSDLITDLGKTFAPPSEPPIQALKLLLDAIGLTFVITGAPIWNIALRNLKGLSAGNHGTSKDAVNGAVMGAFTYVKDKQVELKDKAENLRTTLADIVQTFYEGMAHTRTVLFDGSESSIKILSTFFDDGQLLGNAYTQMDDLSIQKIIKKSLYASLIPLTWKQATNFNVVVIDADSYCDEQYPLVPSQLSQEVTDATQVCVDNWLYYIVTTAGVPRLCTNEGGGRSDCENKSFGIPEGLSTLDGEGWGGLTKEDLVTGAVNSWMAAGKKNDPGSINKDVTIDTMNDITDLNVRAPGIVNIPVCRFDEARYNWEQLKEHGKGGGTANWPCN
ncbi:uncharacterized protein DNG_02785 [Cephalotrichum gorgonifer]|uniref:Uncharacterized protein n=1 Tax=Cephalotrichum gorgonifer TaxID=2041049 RepID=A0AAE8MUT9_9PEZI|nr:uncharacterized protein DNG_02785 [Cephalotrichum gorgonifer]